MVMPVWNAARRADSWFSAAGEAIAETESSVAVVIVILVLELEQEASFTLGSTLERDSTGRIVSIIIATAATKGEYTAPIFDWVS